MKTIYKEILPVALAFLLTGTMASAMAPVESTTQPTIQQVKPVVVKPVTPVDTTPLPPVAPIKWQDNPQHCTSDQYISATEPFNCTDKQVSAPVPTAPQASSPAVTGTHEDWMAAAGISSNDYQYVEYIIRRESGWNPNAVNRTSGAEGLPQALPYSKTGCGHGDAACQLIWANNYAVARYGSWASAQSFWMQHNWW